jgi:hypothetical protein
MAGRIRNTQQINELSRIVDNWLGESDPLLSPIMDTPTGEALIEYWAYRDVFSQQAIQEQGLVGDGWKTANKAASYRDALREIGGALASNDPGFGRLWFTVLSRELGDQEEPEALSSELETARAPRETSPRNIGMMP